MKITLEYPPAANNLYATVRGRRILSKRGREYRAGAAQTAFNSGLRPVSGDVAVRLDVYRPRKAGDLDNSLKAIFDALKGIAWEDDRQVVEIRARRFEDPKNPRVELWIEEPAKP